MNLSLQCPREDRINDLSVFIKRKHGILDDHEPDVVKLELELRGRLDHFSDDTENEEEVQAIQETLINIKLYNKLVRNKT